MHSIYKETAPAVYCEMIPISNHEHLTRFRQNNTYSLAQPRTERGKRSLLYSGVLFWSQIPAEMKTFSKKVFKWSLKKYLIENGIT